MLRRRRNLKQPSPIEPVVVFNAGGAAERTSILVLFHGQFSCPLTNPVVFSADWSLQEASSWSELHQLCSRRGTFRHPYSGNDGIGWIREGRS